MDAKLADGVQTWELIERMAEVLGERATLALVQYSAQSAVNARWGAAPRAEMDPLQAMDAVSSMVDCRLRIITQEEGRFELEMIPGPALARANPSIIAAFCEGVAKGAVARSTRRRELVSALRHGGARLVITVEAL